MALAIESTALRMLGSTTNHVTVQRTLKKSDYSEEEMTPVGTSIDLAFSTQPHTAPTTIVSLNMRLGVSSRPG